MADVAPPPSPEVPAKTTPPPPPPPAEEVQRVVVVEKVAADATPAKTTEDVAARTKRAASEPSSPAEPTAMPKRTFTLPTGEPLTVVNALPPPTPSAASEKPELVTVVESPTSSPVLSPVSAAPSKETETVLPMKLESAKDIVAVEKATKAAEPVETVPVVVVEKVVDPKPVLATAKTMPVLSKVTEATPLVVLPAETVKKEAIIVPVTSAPAQSTPIVVERPVAIIDKPTAPIIPVMQTVVEKVAAPTPVPSVVRVVEEKTAAPKKSTELIIVPTSSSTPMMTPAVMTMPPEVRSVGTLEPLKRKIAIFQNYVAQTSTVLRFSDKFHHELVDAAGSPIFHLHHRHHLIDEHGHLVACVHKSLWCGR